MHVIVDTCTCTCIYLHSCEGECVMSWVSTKTAVVVVDLLQLGNVLEDDWVDLYMYRVMEEKTWERESYRGKVSEGELVRGLGQKEKGEWKETEVARMRKETWSYLDYLCLLILWSHVVCHTDDAELTSWRDSLCLCWTRISCGGGRRCRIVNGAWNLSSQDTYPLGQNKLTVRAYASTYMYNISTYTLLRIHYNHNLLGMNMIMNAVIS